jgi:hypothetical protein
MYDTAWDPFPDVIEFYGTISAASLVQEDTGGAARYVAAGAGGTLYGYLSQRGRLFWLVGTGPSVLFYGMDSDQGIFGVGWSGRIGLEWRLWRRWGIELAGEVQGWIGANADPFETAGAAAAWLGVTASF